jgi:CheY-like chemotaxis protein
MEIFLRKRFQVRVVGTPREALRVADSGFDPEVVLMDINIDRDTSGIDLMKQLRDGNKVGGETVFVAFTAYSLPGDRENLIEAGFDSYLGKPFTRDELMQVIDQALKQHDQVQTESYG